jgi:ribulose-phosphate 3-epimerase
LRASRASGPWILPSLLLCDFGNLEREVAELEAAGLPGMHLDCMDGQFVPNFTYGMPIVAAVRRLTELPLEAHLMIADPQRFVGEFVEAGADVLTIHAEAVDDPRPVLAEIRARGAAAGLAINPGTSLAAVEGALDECDLVLVMSVNPGFGGQKFETVALEKVAALAERRRAGKLNPELVIEIDGGVNLETIAECVAAGCDICAAGSAIFRGGDFANNVARLYRRAREGFDLRSRETT